MKLWQSYVEVVCSYLSRPEIRVQNASGSSTGFLLSPFLLTVYPIHGLALSMFIIHLYPQLLLSRSVHTHTHTEAFLSGDSTVNHTGQGRLTITAMLSVDGFSSLQPSMKMLFSFLLDH